MTGRKQLRKIWLKLARNWKTGDPRGELHHIFGRDGRLLACQLFIRRLAFNHDSETELKELLRQENRREHIIMRTANRANNDMTTCWYSKCWFRSVCPLYEKDPRRA
jgi:hypothetical protein